mmetsp:Transcript_2882/g.6487  ORF Transcript_2882/g.6487 Transcript_2882/m.6487 type:complete len:205 (-) Transcript_2882:557-1171(-)
MSSPSINPSSLLATLTASGMCSLLPSVSASTSCRRRFASEATRRTMSRIVFFKSSPSSPPSDDSVIPLSALSSSKFSRRAHWNLPSLKSTSRSRARSAGSGSVRRRRATYGYATSRKRNCGFSVMQMPSCVSRLLITRLNRSGIRIWYWKTSTLNFSVTVRKLKPPMSRTAASCQISSSAGTMGVTSVPGARNPRRSKSYAIST